MSAKAELLARIKAASGYEVVCLLRDAPEELQADRELVRVAVAQRGFALRYAAPELRADRELVRVAVAQNGDALYHAAPELQADRELVRVAVAQDWHSLEYAAPELRRPTGSWCVWRWRRTGRL